MKQIQQVSKLPEPDRPKHMEALTRDALDAAKESSRAVATQLLSLAEFACPTNAPELKREISLAMASH